MDTCPLICTYSIQLSGSDMSLINANTTATVRNLSFARMGKF